MKLSNIVEKIESQAPEIDSLEVARVATLMASSFEDMTPLEDGDLFHEIWDEITLRLTAASDQHAAVTEELQELAESDPKDFTRDQIWVLIRAIKVQSQILRLYVGDTKLGFC